MLKFVKVTPECHVKLLGVKGLFYLNGIRITFSDIIEKAIKKVWRKELKNSQQKNGTKYTK